MAIGQRPGDAAAPIVAGEVKTLLAITGRSDDRDGVILRRSM